jgi:hypothetical protein
MIISNTKLKVYIRTKMNISNNMNHLENEANVKRKFKTPKLIFPFPFDINYKLILSFSFSHLLIFLYI